MKLYWIFILLAALCALFADKIDSAIATSPKLRKSILLLDAILLLLSAGVVIAILL